MKASELIYKKNYPDFPEFAEYDIPLDRISAALITTLQSVRDKTETRRMQRELKIDS